MQTPSGFVLPESNARTPSIGIDELDAGGFERSFDHLECGPAWLTCSRFKLVNGDDAYTREFGEFQLAPTQSSRRSMPALAWVRTKRP